MSQTTKAPKGIGNVLVVGGCGFLGSHVVDQLLNFPSESESDVSSTQSASIGPNSARYAYAMPSLRSRYPAYDPQRTQVHALDLTCVRNRYPGCRYHEADITNPEQLLQVFSTVRPDVVINTASPSFEAPHAILRKVNIEGTRTLLEVAGGKHGDWGGRCKVFVHTSSASVVSDAQSDLKNANEQYPYVCPNPREYYSETKVYAEQLVLAANRNEELGGMLTAALRPAGIVGEQDMGGLTWGMLKQAQVSPGWQLHIQLGEGDNLFDTTYVGNVVYGHLVVVDALLETAKRGEGGVAAILDHEKVDGEAFFVTNDQPIYFWEIGRYLYSRYGRDIDTAKVWALPEGLAYVIGALSEVFGAVSGRKGKINRQTVKYSCIHRYYSCEKLKRRCGYRPLVSIEEGLARSVKWFKSHEEQQLQATSPRKKAQ